MPMTKGSYDAKKATEALRRGIDQHFYPDRRAQKTAAFNLLKALKEAGESIPGEEGDTVKRVVFDPVGGTKARIAIGGRDALVVFNEETSLWSIQVNKVTCVLDGRTFTGADRVPRPGLELRFDPVDEWFVVGDPRAAVPPGTERRDALEALIDKLVELLAPE